MLKQETPLEMWAGLECTLNRVQDRWINQEDKNGHHKRLNDDFEQFKTLGVKKTRYPCLWELVAPLERGVFNWQNLDERLQKLKEKGIDIIATFLHHGSGPHYTNLIDEEFPEKLEEYAKAFGERYPWIEDYTPINEINTTTRFSLLYGHWYPHHKMDHKGYIRSLYLQCKGTILAMRAIRKVNPKARLVQTDDLGRCQSTEPLKDQAEFENHRRWLSWDMLAGKIDENHALFDYLSTALTIEEMKWLKENACPPDFIGVNHYILSNRFLDHRKELYQKEFYMDIGTRPVYADVGAVDTSESPEMPSPLSLIEETWERYHLPIAVTEVHTMGDRSSQMRWLYEVWNAAKEAKEKGIGIKAITVWSLLGTYDWHKLCTVCELFYEPGVFDLRSPDKKPRPTGVSRLVQDLAKKGDSDLPILKTEGWWKTNRRLRVITGHGHMTELFSGNKPRILITGGAGKLGQAFARTCGLNNIPYVIPGRKELDITNLNEVRQKLRELRPWAVINSAGLGPRELSEGESEACYLHNVTGPFNLALACAELKIPLIHFSSDQVFDGKKGSAYFENDPASPVNFYGLTKWESEKIVSSVHPDALIIRTSSFFGPWEEENFVIKTIRRVQSSREILAADDVLVTPTYLPDLAVSTLDLLFDGVKGLIHLTNQGEVSWSDFTSLTAKFAACKLGGDTAQIVALNSARMKSEDSHPLTSALKSEKFDVLPSLESALDRYFDQIS